MAIRELAVAVRHADDGPVLELVGDIDSRADAALQAAWDEAAAGARTVVLDFARTSYINSTGIALIVQLLANARARGITLSARGLSEHYRTIFEITRLADFITIADV
jgi:anti-anti-sigma factor